MAFERLGAPSLDYMPWWFAGSKLLFRGPERIPEGRYALFLGGTETYGKFIDMPFPARVEEMTGLKCVNFGWPNAGVDVFLNEPALLNAATGARAVILQGPSASNMTNRFYSVHPRRNDRFLRPSALMKSVFDEVDFTQFHFTRHLLRHLQISAPDRFSVLRQELRVSWIARMRLLLSKLGDGVILLWFSSRKPGEDADCVDVARDPAFVTRQMLTTVSEEAAALVTVCASKSAQARGTQGMVFSDLEAPAAAELLGPKAHEEAARALRPVIEKISAQDAMSPPD